MHTQSMGGRFFSFVLLAGLAVWAQSADAKDKKTKPADPKDEIGVVGHVPPTDGPVRRFLTTSHYSSSYLYAEHDAGKGVTLIDVTKLDHPAVLGNVAYSPAGDSASLSVVSGTAALVASEPAGPVSAPPQSVKIMDFSDPSNPKVAREFTGITALSHDSGRGLIFIANADGIWILQQKLAEDPAVEKSYADYVLYGSSMYR